MAISVETDAPSEDLIILMDTPLDSDLIQVDPHGWENFRRINLFGGRPSNSSALDVGSEIFGINLPIDAGCFLNPGRITIGKIGYGKSIPIRIGWNLARITGSEPDSLEQTARHLAGLRFVADELEFTHLQMALQRAGNINIRDRERLEELLHLEDDWDGYGGTPTTQAAVTTAAKLIRDVFYYSEGGLLTSFAAPRPDGGLDIGWKGLNDNRVQLLLVVPSSGQDVRYVATSLSGPNDLEDSGGNLDRTWGNLNDLVAQLLG